MGLKQIPLLPETQRVLQVETDPDVERENLGKWDHWGISGHQELLIVKLQSLERDANWVIYEVNGSRRAKLEVIDISVGDNRLCILF